MDISDCTKFQLRLNQQRIAGEFCDAQITAREGIEFMAHIPVLAAASKHFKREFTSDFQEAKDGKVKLDMDADIVELLLRYMYTYNITIDVSIAIRLLPEARYLQLSGLKQRCAELLLANVTPSNCIEMWSFARLYTCGKMKDRAWKMMCSNFDSLIDTPEFLELSKDSILSLLADKSESLARQETNVFSGVCNWVRADLEDRKQHMKELFSLVRLSSLDKDYLVNIVGKEPLVTKDVECVQLYLHYLHSLVMKGPSLSRNCGINSKGSKASRTWTNGPKLDVKMNPCSAVVFEGRIYCASEEVAVLSQGSCSLLAPPSDDIDWRGWKLCVVAESLYAIGVVSGNNNVYKFDKESETWTLVHSADKKDCDIVSATAFNNRICVADKSTRTIETFDPTQPESGFVVACSFPADLIDDFPLCVVDGRIMTVGGWTANEAGVTTNQVYMFDPQTASWSTGPSIGESRSAISATEYDGRLVIAGGHNGKMNVVQMLVDGEWKRLPSLQRARCSCGFVVVDNVMYVIGGLGADRSVEMLRLEGEK